MLEGALEWLGYGLCHQLPERSFFGGGVQVPVCARDTGIYVGFVASFAVLAWLHRDRPRGFPRGPVWALMAIAVLYMGWDGVTSYAGLRESTNLLRLTSGIGVGYACAALIFPMLNDVLWRFPGPGAVLRSPRHLWIWAGSSLAVGAIMWWLAPNAGVVYPVMVAFAIVLTLAAINLVVIGMLPAFDRKATRVRQLGIPFALATAVALAEIWAAGLARQLLVAAVGGLT